MTTPKGLIRSAEAQRTVDAATDKLALYQFEACPFCVKVRRFIRKNSLKIELKDAKNNKTFSDKNEKSEKGDLVIFDYSATVNGEKFEGSEGKNTKLEIGKDLFLKGFDEQLIGVKVNDSKTIEVNLD